MPQLHADPLAQVREPGRQRCRNTVPDALLGLGSVAFALFGRRRLSLAWRRARGGFQTMDTLTDYQDTVWGGSSIDPATAKLSFSFPYSLVLPSSIQLYCNGPPQPSCQPCSGVSGHWSVLSALRTGDARRAPSLSLVRIHRPLRGRDDVVRPLRGSSRRPCSVAGSTSRKGPPKRPSHEPLAETCRYSSC